MTTDQILLFGLLFFVFVFLIEMKRRNPRYGCELKKTYRWRIRSHL